MREERYQNLYHHLPNQPGVYLFKDQTGQVIYVGKAINLKKRVSSYFARNHKDRPWTGVMVGLIDSVETIVVKNEVEALMLEATQIKQHMPRFNIRLTDDKAYPFIKLVTNEPIPRFTITRRQSKDQAQYFGPYLSARAAANSLEFLRRLYGIHIAATPLRSNRDRACLNCQLDGFSCPLAGEIDEVAYRERINKAVDFLQGKRKYLVRELEERMHEAADNHQFELAAKLRDRLRSVQHILGRQEVISTAQEDYDVIGTSCANSLAAVAVLRIREGRVMNQKAFYFEIVGDETADDIVRTFLISIYLHFSDIPKVVALESVVHDQEGIEELLSGVAGHRVTLRSAQRGEKRSLVELAQRNAKAKLESRLVRSDRSFTGLIALQELLKLPTLPSRIEAVDISNLGSSEPVGAIVCFIDGQPSKDDYRRYKIKTVEGQNDFAMIRELVSRRFSDTSRPVPELFVVDGGPEQLKFALEALALSPRQPHAIISLAKKPDRIFLPGRKLPIAASRGHKGLLLLSRIRDEVHRFGITFQRQRQNRKSLQSTEN